MLTSFKHSANCVVIGASGGIGAALTGQLSSDPSVDVVHAFSRQVTPQADPKIRPARLDLDDDLSIESAAMHAAAEGPLDLVIVATGLLHIPGEMGPEKRLEELQRENLARAFSINTIGPALVAKHFLPRLQKGHKSVFAVLSARVGSISDNRSGGWAAYRASKAALNMLTRTFAIEQARRSNQSIVVALHPGTVATALSEPFSARLPKDKLFAPADAASKLIAVIDELSPDHSGGFFAWDSQRIEF